jgi:hypothetical protein
MFFNYSVPLTKMEVALWQELQVLITPKREAFITFSAIVPQEKASRKD